MLKKFEKFINLNIAFNYGFKDEMKILKSLIKIGHINLDHQRY